MKELNEFCHKYLPQYFAFKYNNGDLKRHIFDYKNQENVFQMTSNIFSLVDILQSSNSDLGVAKIIEDSFIFRISDFQKACRDLRQQNQNKTRQVIRKIMKKMKEIDRSSFQIFLRLFYIYFDTKENQTTQKLKKREEYIDQIISSYLDLKMISMTQDDSFVPMSFMEYIIRLLLNKMPSIKFNQVLLKIIQDADFPQDYQTRIKDKIEQINKKLQNRNKVESILKNSGLKNIQNQKNVISQQKDKNLSKQKAQPNDKTPIKDKSANKIQRNTHESSQKKQNIIQRNQQDARNLESLKMTLKMHKKTAPKQRTLYSRSKYLIPKRAQSTFDQNSSTGSNQNNNQELYIIDINRTFSSRFLDMIEHEQQDYLAGATPKPKKKVKLIEKTFSGTFDQNGDFIRGF